LDGPLLYRQMTQEWWLIMTSTPDNRPREEPLSAYEYGVWVFLAFAGGTALGLIAYLGYILSQ